MFGYFFIPIGILCFVVFVLLAFCLYRYTQLQRSGRSWYGNHGYNAHHHTTVVITEPFPSQGNAFPAQTSCFPNYPPYPAYPPAQPTSQSSSYPVPPPQQQSRRQIGFVSQEPETPPPPYPGITAPPKSTS